MRRVAKKAKCAFIPHTENDFQPHILKPRSLFVIAVVLLLIKFLVFSWFFCFPKTSQFAVVVGSQLVELVNKERVALGFQPLKVSGKLVQAAQEKAQDMLNNNYFAHTSPTGINPWYWLDKVGYKYTAAGENLAKDFKDSQFVHQAWMESSSHRANILKDNYQEIGIAVVEGEINGKETLLAVQFFGKSVQEPEVKPSAPLVVSDTNVELPSAEEETGIEGRETGLKGPLVFAQQEHLEEIAGKSKNALTAISEKSEPLVQKIYFIILGVLGLVLLLTVFINIRTQHPKLIFIVLIFIVLIAAIASFNGQEFLNRGVEIL
jgi:hypothetical protein